MTRYVQFAILTFDYCNGIFIMQEPTAVEVILEYILEVMRLCSLGLLVTEMIAELDCRIFCGP